MGLFRVKYGHFEKPVDGRLPSSDETLSAESSSIPATSVVSFPYCSPGFLPGIASNSRR